MRQPIKLAKLALIVLLAGCTSLDAVQPNLDGQDPGSVSGVGPNKGSLISNNTGSLISNNSGSLVSNNSASLTGSVMAPSSLVSNNSSNYRIAALAEVPLQRALVYLTDTRDRNYLDPRTGQVMATTTDDQGTFAFDMAPATDSLVVNAAISGNRRMVGFLLTSASQSSQVTLTLSSTLVTEFLRSQALALGRTLGSYDPQLTTVPALNSLTQAALDAGKLEVPDLAVGRIPQMNRNYLVGVATRLPQLKQTWETLLGRNLSVVQTVAGLRSGFAGDGGAAQNALFASPNGLVRASDGTLYLADSGNNRIRKIAPDGTVTTVAGGGTYADIANRISQGAQINVLGDATTMSPTGTDGDATKAILEEPRGVVLLPNNRGLLISEFVGSRIRWVDANGDIRTILGTNGQMSSSDGPLLGNPVATPSVYFPMHMAVGPDGGIYLADTSRSVVRKLTGDMTSPATFAATAQIQRVAGFYKGKRTGVFPDGVAATEADLMTPSGLCFDEVGNLYISMPLGHLVAKLTPEGKIYNLAGNGSETVSGDGGAATQAGVPYPAALAFDQAQHRLLIGTWTQPRIRAVDLTTGLISTVIGEGASTDDGLIGEAQLSDIGSFWLEPSGNLLFTEIQSARLRRLWLTEPAN